MHTHRIYMRTRASRYSDLTGPRAIYFTLPWHHQVAMVRRTYREIRQLQRDAGLFNSREYLANKARFLVTDMLGITVEWCVDDMPKDDLL